MSLSSPSLVVTRTERQSVDAIIEALHARVAPDIDAAVIAAEVDQELDSLSAARMTRSVPILVESPVRARLCRHRPA